MKNESTSARDECYPDMNPLSSHPKNQARKDAPWTVFVVRGRAALYLRSAAMHHVDVLWSLLVKTKLKKT